MPDLFDRLLAHGVLVRDVSTRPRLTGCLRVTVGTPDENDTFLSALGASLDQAAAPPSPTAPTATGATR